MKNFGILIILTAIFSIGAYFSNKPTEMEFKAPMIMSDHIIEREEYRDSIVQSVKNRIEKNTADLDKIEQRMQQLKNK